MKANMPHFRKFQNLNICKFRGTVEIVAYQHFEIYAFHIHCQEA